MSASSSLSLLLLVFLFMLNGLNFAVGVVNMEMRGQVPLLVPSTDSGAANDVLVGFGQWVCETQAAFCLAVAASTALLYLWLICTHFYSILPPSSTLLLCQLFSLLLVLGLQLAVAIQSGLNAVSFQQNYGTILLHSSLMISQLMLWLGVFIGGVTVVVPVTGVLVYSKLKEIEGKENRGRGNGGNSTQGSSSRAVVKI